VRLHKAIAVLYPSVVVIHGDTAYDADGNEVVYDLAIVEAKTLELQAEKIATKQSALNKLMALGLTEEEALALGVK
jgi:hypothetical protein